MVEWKKIEEIGSFFGGLTGKTKEDFEDGNAKFITYMNVFANSSLNPSVVGVVKINEGEKQNKVQKGDILFTGSSETPEETGMSCVVTEDLDGDFYMNSFCFGIRVNQLELYNLGYLKHILRSNSIRKEIAKSASGVTRFNISKARFGKILIPLPSLSEQERIVGILDTFTAAIENLKAQIANRRKQYEHYRDQLLDLEGKEGVEMKLLISCANILYGYPFESKLFTEDDTYIPLIRIRDVKPAIASTYYSGKILDEYIIKKGDILVGMDGEFNIGKWNDRDGLLNQRVLKMSGKDNVCLNGFLYHYMKPVFKKIEMQTAGGSVKHLSAKTINSIVILLPSLSEQSRIVSILDTFEASIANLEAQLKEREKQYEYYRNKLLSF